ncbi:MAG: AAA family ATPase [bacterium]|nr:AAA family ATPase [bacterium]
MIIEGIKLENFTVFEDIDIDFCKGVNIFLGENGTGKTHLLKMLYYMCSYQYGEVMPFSTPFPWELFIGLRKIKGQSKDILSTHDKAIPYSVNIKVDNISFNYDHSVFCLSADKANWKPAVFIPTKEMLSHSKGLLALKKKGDVLFDKTLTDIVAKAALDESKSISQLSQKLLNNLSGIIDGKVVYEEDTFYIVKNNGQKIEFSIEAEGLRKFGLLWKLIRNGLIENGTVLFWDLPEESIRPKLIPNIAEMLLELQRNDVQIFLTTHDYNLAKYFEIKQKQGDNVVYHSLFKTKNGVQHAKAVTYRDIANNPIEEADEKLYNDILHSVFCIS